MSDLEQKLYDAALAAVKAVYGLEPEPGQLLIESPKDPRLGDYATSLAMKMARTLRKPPLEIAEALLRSGAIDIVVIDSVAALVPRAEIDGEMGDSFVGIQARLMSQAMRKLTGVVAKTNAIALFINQIREKVGVMYGNPETTPGGRALKFYSSVRLDVRKGEQLKNGSEVIGNRTKVKVVKNKVAPPFRTCEFDLIFGQGISREGSLLDMAVAKDIIVKSGAWFSYNDQRIAQGRDNARQYLKDHPEIADEIDALLRRQLAQTSVPAVSEDEIPEMDVEADMNDGDEE